ncbi:DedA family protein [Halieaceae bacterium IMCC14734]|uniref:DedA family protein n=1 Tax=Candidatus Litorirhabdus singularis TaxID=2518993 RepID=A0ABT3TDU7_9GAMM|nr:DedA family protein [Candidatus Litorirhabdus singularis]MCX2980466.1 DedA family protein [Candidatus Litorirhabdus singularis]
MTEYLLLFLTALAAASVIPVSSEILLLALLGTGLNPMSLWLTATLGNTLGAVINWFIGTKISDHADSRWVPVSSASVERASHWFNRYGVWSLLLSWLPVVGDALTFFSGIMRVRFALFLVLVAIGKGARYAVLIITFEALPL